jgi:hypothetical protein
MSTAPISGPIQIANKSSTAWALQDPVLLLGQLGLETDTRKLKAGDGITTWNLLNYITGTGDGGGGASAYTDLTDAATATLPTTNAPLSTALGLKAPLANPTFTGSVGGVTKSHVGLGNADNTSDAAKPVSTLQAAAIALKANLASPAFTGTPTGITKTHVGLANVDNTTDLAKPVSTLTAAALAAKQATLIAGTGITIDGTNTISTTIGAVAQQVAYTSVIPLDTPGNGKYMTSHAMTGNVTLTVGSGPVEQGNCNFALVGDGSSTLDVSAFTNGNGFTYVTTLGANNIYTAIYTYGTPILYGVQGGATATIPGQVTALILGTATATTQPLSWTAPASGGTPTDYLVEYKAAASGTWLTFSDGVSATASTTVTGLIASTSYNYRVSASNTAGTGTASATGTGSTLSAPGQVTNLAAGTATTTTQPLTWTAPISGGATADYIVEYKTAAGSTWVTFPDGTSTTPSATVTGLSSGVSYNYRVSATNSAGTGTVSSTLTASTAGGGGRITFTDDFTGTNGDAPNARWTGDTAGWEINTNHIRFTGGTYSFVKADCTAGDNTIDVDMDVSAALFSFGGIVFNYTDDNNYNAVTLNVSGELRIQDVIAGVVTESVDTGHDRFGGSAAHLEVVHSGANVTVTVTGGGDPGSFGPYAITRTSVGTKVGLAMNTGKSLAFFDNFELS